MAILSAYLIAASAIIVFCLGTLHMVLTFRGNKFWPRDTALKTALESAKIHLSPQTTFWKSWICFNATHSLGAMLFGAIYVYLSLCGPVFFFQSYFLIVLGFFTLLGYAFLVGRSGFSTPFRGILLAMLFYAGGIVSFFLRIP